MKNKKSIYKLLKIIALTILLFIGFNFITSGNSEDNQEVCNKIYNNLMVGSNDDIDIDDCKKVFVSNLKDGNLPSNIGLQDFFVYEDFEFLRRMKNMPNTSERSKKAADMIIEKIKEMQDL